jgi:SET domain-containing protein
MSRMLLVRTYLAPSPVAGIGLFAAEPITKDTIIWVFDSRIDRLFGLEERESSPEPLRTFLRTYGYPRCPGSPVHILDGDNARFMNHSKLPNTYEWRGDTAAARDIDAGEELLCDYDEFEPGHELLP